MKGPSRSGWLALVLINVVTWLGFTAIVHEVLLR